MLDPDRRSLYTSLLTPPPGFVLDQALGTTFSLDISTLLMLPVHLSLLGAEELEDGIAVYESVRRTMDRITLYVQRGRIQAPRQGNTLFGLLAPSMIEVEPRTTGVFHPKLWLLRFRPGEGLDARPVLRLAVLSRNVTDDRSWDLSLQLEGEVDPKTNSPLNQPLADLIRNLPSLASGQMPASCTEQAESLTTDLLHCAFALPEGVESMEFAVLGMGTEVWKRPRRSDRLAVISPFCGEKALAALARSTREPVVLISRPETLDQLSRATLQQFSSCRVLHEAAETEDSDDDISQDRYGLHAKAWITERGARTAITLGSANATDAALVSQINVELMVTLEGPRRQLGDISSLLGEDGFGAVLQPHEAGVVALTLDPLVEAAKDRLDRARKAIMRAELRASCQPAATQGQWHLLLHGMADLPATVQVRLWPVSLSSAGGVTWAPDAMTAESLLAEVGPAHLTGVIAFELSDAGAAEGLRFVLNLPVDGMPVEAREAAILRAIIQNRDGFLRYLLLLLAREEGGGTMFALPTGTGSGRWAGGFDGDLPLLEEMTRCYSRSPERLDAIARMIARLRSSADAQDVIPQEFDTIWSVFEQALESRHG